MKIFLSWSGEKSRLAAETLRNWLPDVIQSVEPWVSSSDIDAGSRWNQLLNEQLSMGNYGIIALTAENQLSPWILFEAGALAKTLTGSYVCPYLIDLPLSGLERGPLTQFQAKEANREGTRDLLSSINKALGADALPEERLDRVFEHFWPDLERSFERIRALSPETDEMRPVEDTLEEVLLIARDLSRRDTGDTTSRPVNYYDYVEKVRALRLSPKRTVRRLAEIRLSDLALIEDAVMRAVWAFFNPHASWHSGSGQSLAGESLEVDQDQAHNPAAPADQKASLPGR